MESTCRIVNLIWPVSAGEAVREARRGYEAGADAVIADLRFFPEAERTIETFRKIIAAVPGTWMFCLYRSDSVYGEDDERRMETLLRCAEAGAAYVDVMADLYDPQPNQISYCEAAIAKQRAVIERVHAFGAKAVVSTHVMDTFLAEDDAIAILKEQESRGADVVKLVSRCETDTDLEESRRIFARLNDETGVPWVFLGVGAKGHDQRFLGAKSGCAMQFAKLEPPEDGLQPTIAEFLDRFGRKRYSR